MKLLTNSQQFWPRSYRRLTARRDVQSKVCQLLHNSIGTTCTTSPKLIEVSELEGYSRPTYNELVHSATTRSTVVGVIHKLTVDVFLDHTNTTTTWCGDIFQLQNVDKYSHDSDHAHLADSQP